MDEMTFERMLVIPDGMDQAEFDRLRSRAAKHLAEAVDQEMRYAIYGPTGKPPEPTVYGAKKTDVNGRWPFVRLDCMT